MIVDHLATDDCPAEALVQIANPSVGDTALQLLANCKGHNADRVHHPYECANLEPRSKPPKAITSTIHDALNQVRLAGALRYRERR